MLRWPCPARIMALVCLLTLFLALSGCGAIVASLLKDHVEKDDEICQRQCSHIRKTDPFYLRCFGECKDKAERAKLEELEKREQERRERERAERREQERVESDKIVTDKVLKSLGR